MMRAVEKVLVVSWFVALAGVAGTSVYVHARPERKICGWDVIAVTGVRRDTVTMAQVCAPASWWAWRKAHPGSRYVRETPEGVKYVQ